MRADQRTAYRRAMAMGERVWEIVHAWPAFERGTVGRPLVRSVDAVGAALGAALGASRAAPVPQRADRYRGAARGALREAEAWLAKAHRRGLLPRDAHAALRRDVAVLARHLARRRRTTALVLAPSVPGPSRSPRRSRRPP